MVTKAVATINGDNLVSIPDEIGNYLGVGAGGQVEFIVEDDGRVTIRPREYTLEETFGSLPELPNMSHDFDVEIEDAISEAVDRKMERLARQASS